MTAQAAPAPFSDCQVRYSNDGGKTWTLAPLTSETARLTVTAFQRVRSPESGVAETYGEDTAKFMLKMAVAKIITLESWISVEDKNVLLSTSVKNWKELIRMAGEVERVVKNPTHSESPDSKKQKALAELESVFLSIK